jgi:hypothetical protein
MTLRRAMTRVLSHPVTWLVVLVLAFFYKEAFLGRIFSPADLLYDFPPWTAQRPAAYLHPSNAVRSDEAFIFYPRREQIASDVAKFGIPLWQDHNFAGTPNAFSLNFVGAFVYPPMWSYVFFPPGVANTLLHVPIPLLAALCMYLFLGRLTRHRMVRLVGAMTWGLNGYFIVWLSAFFLPLTLAVLPLALYLADRFLEQRRRWAGIAYALVVGWSFFLGYPPANVILLTFLGIYLAAWLAVDLRARVRRFLEVAALTLIGIGIGGLPIVTGVVQLSQLAQRGGWTGLPFKDLQTFIFPNTFGNPIAVDWRFPQGNYCEYVAYFGSIPLILAGAGGLAFIARRDFRFPILSAATATGIVAFLLAYQLGPASLIGHLPVYGAVSPARWHIGVVFAGVVLGAYALDLLLSGRLPRWTLLTAGGVVLAAAAVIALVHRHDFVGPDQFLKRDEVLRLLVLLAGATVLAGLLWFRSTVAALLLTVIVAVDLFTFGVDFNPAIRPADFYPTTPALRYLQAHAPGYRVLVARKTGLIWPGDVLPTYGIDSVTGYDHFRDASYVSLLGSNISAEEKSFWQHSGYLTLGQALNLDSPVLDQLSVKYAFFPDQASDYSLPGSDHWQIVYVGADGRILENLQALPRQFLISDAGSPEPIEHTAQRPDRDQLDVTGPGRLVWSKPNTPDWTVAVDGRGADTTSFGGYFLSVDLPAGPHVVTLDYRPTAYAVGAVISAISLLLIGLIGLAGLARRKW